MLVERGEHIGPIDPTCPASRAFQPVRHRRPRSDPRRLGPEQLGDRHACFGSAPHKARIYVVV
jgi:hypothetical protein